MSSDDDDLMLLIRQSEIDTKIIEAFRALSRVPPEILQRELRIALERIGPS